MIGLDTNVLIRYITQDDAVPSARATALLEHGLSEDNPGYVSTVVIAEIVWILHRAYGFSTSELVATIERLLSADVLLVESEQEVFAAMVAVRNGIGTFSDALIGALNRTAGCAHTATFDRRALRLPGFARL